MEARYLKIIVFGFDDRAATHRLGLQVEDGRYYLVNYVVLATGAYLLSRSLKLSETYESKERAMAAAEILQQRIHVPIEVVADTYEELCGQANALLTELIRKHPCLGTL